MARQGLLKALVFAALSVAGTAYAQTDEPDDLLHRPQRLTIAPADELLGQLSPDGKTLYFLSNVDTMNQIFAEDITDGRAKQLFDENADVTWPRVSPDGRLLAYISYDGNAFGRLCVRELPNAGDRRCLSGAAGALQLAWIDRSRIVLVSRPSVGSAARALEVDAGSTLSAKPLLDRDFVSPAVSPDGRWLVYLRDQRLEAVRLSDTNTSIPIAIDLPGLAGQPAFSHDGRFLYFVQFLDDSNRDGVVDAHDGGVLFRATFSDGVLGSPQQLTETSFACEYPMPAADRLVATCARRGSLSIYALPLDGEVPAAWTKDQLVAASENATAKSERELLASRRFGLETGRSERRLALLALVSRYLDLEYFGAADFYAEKVADLRDRATNGLSRVVLALVAQRRADRDRERGVMVHEFRENARRRLDDLEIPGDASPVAIALAHVVRSEIADAIGDKARARSELEAVSLDASAPAPLVEIYYERADALYRELDDREALANACRRLSEVGAVEDQLHYARAAVRTMVRGLPRSEAIARLERERAPADSELAFALDVARALFALRDADPPAAVTDPILALYARQSRADRRSALVDEAAVRARDVGAKALLEELAKRHLADARPGMRERVNAERLFRRVMTGAALRHIANGELDQARADFDAVVKETGSYESAVASIDVRLQAGEPKASVAASYAAPGPLSDFAKAYVLAKESDGTTSALALLDASWSALREQRMAQALDGALLHQRWLATGERSYAERANVQYVLALEGARRGTPFRAMVLGLIGILNGELGNWRVAVDYLQERDALPYTDGPAALGVRLAFARALVHSDRFADAAKVADGALAMVERTPDLAPYRILALDRAALYNVAANRFARALVLYDAQAPLLEAATGASAERNRFVARIGRAAAAIGAGQPAIALGELDAMERSSFSPQPRLARTYALLGKGLRAKALHDLGRFDEEARAVESRRAMLVERFANSRRTEIEQAIMLAETQLALNAGDRKDRSAAASWLRQALGRADDLRARSRGAIDRQQLDVLWAAAQLEVAMGSPLVSDLPRRLSAANDAIGMRPDAELRALARRFEAFLPILPRR